MTKYLLWASLMAAAMYSQTPPVFYPSGLPAGCTTPAGFTLEALCTVPGELPIGSSPAPSAGSTWQDANFGGSMRVLSDVTTFHTYSTISPFSRTGKYVSLKLATTGTSILEAATGRVAYTNKPGSITSDGIYWDGMNDEVYYYISGTKLMKHVLSTGSTSVLIDYAVTHGFTKISAGGTGDVTGDNWFAFFAQTQGKVCALDIGNMKTYCASYAAPHPDNRVGWSFLDYAMMSKAVDSTSGKRYVVLVAKPALGVFSVDFTEGTLRFEYRGPEFAADTQTGRAQPGNGDGVCDAGEACLATAHADLFGDSDGRQYLMRVEDIASPCGRVVATNELSKGVLMNRPQASGGGRTDLLRINVCGDASLWTSVHVGCAKLSAYCTVSTDYPGASRNPSDLTTPLRRGPFTSEVFVLRGKGLEVQRLAQSRSVKFSTDSYWSFPRAAISPDGASVLFDSNFGTPNQERSVIMSTGFAAPQQMMADDTSYAVTGMTLINMTTKQPVPGYDPIPNGARIKRSALGLNNITVRANTSGPAQGVSFTVNGAKYTTESKAPYAVAGLNNGVYRPWVTAAGQYKLVATPFIVVNGGRVPGTVSSVEFTLE